MKKTPPLPANAGLDKNVILHNAAEELQDLLKKYDIDVGCWITRKQVETLYKILKQTPNITEWKLEAQLRKE